MTSALATNIAGYVIIERDSAKDVVVKYKTVDHAVFALDGDLLIDDLASENALDVYVESNVNNIPMDECEFIDNSDFTISY